MLRLDLVVILMSVVLVGCNGDSAIVPYEVERESDRVLTSELLRDQFNPIPFRWTVPEEWTEGDNDQYSASAWPYIGPFYPYPQVPMGWREVSLEWDDGQWNLNFNKEKDKWYWILSPKNW